MMSRFLKATCLLATTALLASAPAQAGILYDSTGSPRYYAPLDPNPLSYNVNSVPFASGDILWDDVPIWAKGVVSPSVDVTRLSFDILRIANAPAVNLDIYWTSMVADNGLNRGTATIPFDSPMDDPGTKVFVQQIVLPANGAADTRQIVSVGDGTNVLFNTGVLNQSTPIPTFDPNDESISYPVATDPASGFGRFFVGMKISSVLEDNLWVIASHPWNLFFVTDDFQDDVPSTIDEFYFGPDAGGNPIAGTMSMRVEGNILPGPSAFEYPTVPEPASLATLGLAAVGLIGRRRKIA